MNAVLGGYFHGSRHIRASRFSEFGSSFGEEYLETGWCCRKKHSRRRIAGVFEGVNASTRTPDACARSDLLPLAIREEAHPAFHHIKPFVFIRVVVERRSRFGRRDFEPLRKASAGFLACEIEMNFLPERAEDSIFSCRMNGNRCHGEEIHRNSPSGKREKAIRQASTPVPRPTSVAPRGYAPLPRTENPEVEPRG